LTFDHRLRHSDSRTPPFSRVERRSLPFGLPLFDFLFPIPPPFPASLLLHVPLPSFLVSGPSSLYFTNPYLCLRAGPTCCALPFLRYPQRERSFSPLRGEVGRARSVGPPPVPGDLRFLFPGCRRDEVLTSFRINSRHPGIKAGPFFGDSIYASIPPPSHPRPFLSAFFLLSLDRVLSLRLEYSSSPEQDKRSFRKSPLRFSYSLPIPSSPCSSSLSLNPPLRPDRQRSTLAKEAPPPWSLSHLLIEPAAFV